MTPVTSIGARLFDLACLIFGAGVLVGLVVGIAVR